MTKELYLSNHHYYLLPSKASLSLGNCLISSLTTNEQLSVDPASIAPYEITREEAEAYLRAEIEQGLASFSALAQLQAQEREQSHAASQVRAQNVARALFGFTADELRGNPALAEEHADKIEDFFQGLKTVLSGALTGDAEGLQVANAQMQTFKATVENAGMEISDDFEHLPDQLHDAFYSAERKQNLEEAAAQLDDFRARIPQLQEQLSEFLQEKAQALRDSAATIPVADESAMDSPI